MIGIKIEKLIIYIVEILLSYALLGYYLGKLELPFSLPGSSGIIYIYLIGLLIISACQIRFRPSYGIIILTAFTVFCIPSLLAYAQTSLNIANLLVLLSPVVSYLSGGYIQYVHSKNNQQQLFVIFYSALFIMTAGALIYYFQTPELLIVLRDYTFSIIVLVPFILLSRNSYLKISLFALSFLAIIVSVKRSLIIAFVISIVIYYLISLLKRDSNRKNTRMVTIACVILFIGGSAVFIDKSSDISEQLEARFKSIEDDSGSGRTFIYAAIAANISQSSDLQYLFGHGFNAVATDIYLPAHNDFLEIQYDYGIIALGFWVLFIIHLIRKALILMKRKIFEEAAMLSAVLVLWLIVSMTNCLIINPITTSAFFLFWGLFDNPTLRSAR